MKRLEGRVAVEAFASLMEAGFECGFRHWQAPAAGAPAAFACSKPGPFDIKGCVGFLYFGLAGPPAAGEDTACVLLRRERRMDSAGDFEKIE